MTAYPSLMPKYRRTAALACIASQMTMTGPGISRSPASQRRTVRPLSTRTRRAKASAERPRLCLIVFSSLGVMRGGANQIAGEPRRGTRRSRGEEWESSAQHARKAVNYDAIGQVVGAHPVTSECRVADLGQYRFRIIMTASSGPVRGCDDRSIAINDGSKAIALNINDMRGCVRRFQDRLNDIGRKNFALGEDFDRGHLSSPFAGGHHCPIDQSTIGPMVLISKSRNVTSGGTE